MGPSQAWPADGKTPGVDNNSNLQTSGLLTTSNAFPESPLTPLSATFDKLPGTIHVDEPTTTKSVSQILKSLTNSHRSTGSYELVEEDDYEQSQITPRIPQMISGDMTEIRAQGDGPVRTASISRHLPLHNPTPDLQSVMGAYLKNVQALEESAERLSLAGSIEEEMQKMKTEIHRSDSRGSQHAAQHSRKFSSTSMNNSIIGVNAAARTGGYSPGGFLTSPVGSVHSQRRPSQRGQRVSRVSNFSSPLHEPQHEGRPLESVMVQSPPSHAMQPRQSSESDRSMSQRSVDRPGTSASNDTYRQAQKLFTDFDGTHYDDQASRRMTLNHPPRARDSRMFTESQPDQKTIYYPAPVPVMLNLPKRLSKHNWAQQDKRRTQVLNAIPQENRKSAAWLANAEIDAEYSFEPERPSNRMSMLPPQLRASAFFDAPNSRTDVQLKHGSAVITLDSILDAAAHAPVSAFTDHPIVGHLGNEVYGQEPGKKKKSSEVKQKRQSSMSNLLSKRKSTGAMSSSRRLSQPLEREVEMAEDDPERTAELSLAPGADELVEKDRSDGERDEEEKLDSEEEESSEDESQHQPGFLGAPTTLLAELQMRKAQQKLRNRTATTAGPAGMHSTLLELDAVSQLQQKSRRQKHIALAWEDKDMVEKDNYDDEEVPLGVLFPEKDQQNHVNYHKPLGLMEKRELEENEPLGARRARLRGEAYQPAVMKAQASPRMEEQDSAPAIKLSGVDDEDDEDNEGETLAQRKARIAQKKLNRQSLADDIASQLGLEPEAIGGSKSPQPEQEETLGQRRKRLQAEAEKSTKGLKSTTSMGDLLRANPIGARDERQTTAEAKMSMLNRRDTSMPLVDHIQAAQPSSKAIHQMNSPYHPNQPLHQMQQFQQPQQRYMSTFQMPMNTMQSMPNLNMQANGFPNQYMQPSMSQMNFGMYNPMQMNTGMPMQMPMGGFVPQVAAVAPSYDAIGMGPPLTTQQRTNIDRWRQGIA